MLNHILLFQRKSAEGRHSVNQIPWVPHDFFVYQFRENYKPRELISRQERKRQQYIGEILGPNYGK